MTQPRPARRVVLFARGPVPGRVKTRLAREIGDAAATALYRAFLEDLAAEIPDEEKWESVLAHAEPEAGTFLAKTFAPPWSFSPQGEGDLGARLERFLEWSRANGADVVVAGSDAPTLTRDDLAAAFRALEEGAEIVFAPSPDGGFSLIGARAGTGHEETGGPGDFLEGVRWSTAHALEDARRAAERRGLRVGVLAPVPDVDEAADIALLASYLSKKSSLPSSSSSCPATRRAVETLLARSGA